VANTGIVDLRHYVTPESTSRGANARVEVGGVLRRDRCAGIDRRCAIDNGIIRGSRERLGQQCYLASGMRCRGRRGSPLPIAARGMPISLRELTLGDDIRRKHWKLSLFARGSLYR